MRFSLFVFLCYLFYNGANASGSNDGHVDLGASSSRGSLEHISVEQDPKKRRELEEKLAKVQDNLKLTQQQLERDVKQAHILKMTTKRHMEYADALQRCVRKSDRDGFAYMCREMDNQFMQCHFTREKDAQRFCVRMGSVKYVCNGQGIEEKDTKIRKIKKFPPKQFESELKDEDYLMKRLGLSHPPFPRGQIIIQNQLPAPETYRLSEQPQIPVVYQVHQQPQIIPQNLAIHNNQWPHIQPVPSIQPGPPIPPGPSITDRTYTQPGHYVPPGQYMQQGSNMQEGLSIPPVPSIPPGHYVQPMHYAQPGHYMQQGSYIQQEPYVNQANPYVQLPNNNQQGNLHGQWPQNHPHNPPPY